MKSGGQRLGLRAITHKHLLLCEGMHDVQCFDNLATARGFPQIQTAACGFVTGSARDGIGQLTAALNALPGIPGFQNLEAVLVAADNDHDPSASFASVQNLIAATFEIAPGHRYAVPTAPFQKAGAKPTIVVMMIPWAGIPGALDSLCLSAAAQERPTLAPLVDAFAASAGVGTANGWSVTKEHKMKLRSLISAAYKIDPYISPAWVWADQTDLVPLSGPSAGGFDQIADFLKDFPAFLAAP